jgi:hypothetical protein
MFVKSLLRKHYFQNKRNCFGKSFSFPDSRRLGTTLTPKCKDGFERVDMNIRSRFGMCYWHRDIQPIPMIPREEITREFGLGMA